MLSSSLTYANPIPEKEKKKNREIHSMTDKEDVLNFQSSDGSSFTGGRRRVLKMSERPLGIH